MRAFVLSILCGGLLLPQLGTAQTLGEVCIPDPDAPVRPGISCQATDDFDYQGPFVANAKKGDILLSAGCGMIGTLLRQVSPPQRFSHSGIMVDNWSRVRHSTASEERYPRGADGDGLVPDLIKFGWPGTITETIDEAYEGHPMIDPDGEAYLVKSFNTDIVNCPGDTAAIFPSVVKPPFDQEQQIVSGSGRSVRQTLEGIADQASAIRGHYRFFAYSDAALVGRTQGPGSQAPAEVPWAKADAPDGTVCSQLIWSAAHAAGVQVEDSFVEPGDKPHAVGQGKNGLYVYSEAERRAGAHFLYDLIYNRFYDDAGWWGRLFTDAPDDGANQLTNCFAFDWCGSEPGMEYNGEPDAKDSDRWINPGTGTAVSPDNLTQWDLPPGGVYGLTETLAYNPGEFVRIHRWAASPGTGPVTVNVRFNNAPAAGAVVTLRGFHPVISDGAGAARFIAIPSGNYQLDGIKSVVVGGLIQNVTGTLTVSVAANTGATVTLNLTVTPPPPPTSTRAHRRVTITGTVFIKDYEDVLPNETGTFSIPTSTAVLDPSHREQTFNFSHCVGGEVKVTTEVRLMLNTTDYSVTANVTGRMYEGASCSTNDEEDELTGGQVVVENGSNRIGPLHLVNGYVFGDDEANINITVVNARN